MTIHIDPCSPDTSSADFFEAKYARVADPWAFAKDPYELHRYEKTIAALAAEHYRSAYEPGCSVGVLTERLANLSDRIESIDFSESAVAQARARCAHLENVTILCRSVIDHRPSEPFDLLVLSELGYYFTPHQWQELSSGLIAAVPSGGTILAVHWRGVSPDHRMSGQQVHQILHQNSSMQMLQSDLHESFQLERWRRV